MGEYAEREIDRFIGSFCGSKKSGRGIPVQEPSHNIPKNGLTWKQRRNKKTNARKKRQRERLRAERETQNVTSEVAK